MPNFMAPQRIMSFLKIWISLYPMWHKHRIDFYFKTEKLKILLVCSFLKNWKLANNKRNYHSNNNVSCFCSSDRWSF